MDGFAVALRSSKWHQIADVPDEANVSVLVQPDTDGTQILIPERTDRGWDGDSRDCSSVLG